MNRKRLLLLIIAASYLLVLLLAGFRSIVDVGDRTVNQYLIGFGGWFGLLGAVLLWWQYLIGFRGLTARLVPDLIFLNKLHQRMGKYGYFQIILHPVFTIAGYALPLEFWTQTSTFNNFVRFGTIAFLLLTFVWLTSALFRKRLGFRSWKRLHFIGYLILPLVLIHSYNVGTYIRTSTALNYFWQFLIISYVLILVYRLAFQFGFTRQKFKLIGKQQITHNVYRYDFAPYGSFGFEPKPGQFVYIQPGTLKESHPFTISHFDTVQNTFSITVKQSGRFSSGLTELLESSVVFVDGPFGVFTTEMFATEQSPVFIAGGIGITPFIANLNLLEQYGNVNLFYANQTQKDIAFEEEINQHPQVKVVHVLDKEQADGYAHGFVSVELMQANLDAELHEHCFFICGPKPMMNALTAGLVEAGVPREQIFMEEFAL